VSCIGDAFKVDPSDKAAVTAALGSGQNLLSIYSVYEKLRGKSGGGGANATASTTSSATGSTSGGAASSTASTATPSASAGATAAKSPEAETLKAQGNAAMQRKDHTSAIDLYTRALALSPSNPIYLSNRAAAYSATQQHALARDDAELAVAADPKYTKAWSRLGLARFALGDARGSMEAYRSGIDAEGAGGSEAMKKGYETAKRRWEHEGGGEDDEEVEESDDVARSMPGGGAGGSGGMPDLSALAGMFGGGGGGGGGMPDIGAMMQNPMMRQMAQNMMQNPDMLSNLMNNPQLREMASSFGGGGSGGGGGAGRGGGGMPDLSSLMNDPSIAEM